MTPKTLPLSMDDQGRLVLPAELISCYGLQAGAEIQVDLEQNGLRIRRSANHLAKVYIEPTSRCNLACRTCIRNAWDEPQGDMSGETFGHLMQNLRELPNPVTIFFGGFGEPLFHPNIIGMVRQAKAAAASVELISNGLLLTEEMSRELVASGLDVLWISVDGATAENYADVRPGALLPKVMENIIRIAYMRHQTQRKPELGISFVAMRRNIADLPALLQQSVKLGISQYIVTNVLPYTSEMCAEMLYTRILDGTNSTPTQWAPHLNLPRMDWNDDTHEALYRSLRDRRNVSINGDIQGASNGRCPFVERGAVVVGWDGTVSPCLGLMHDYETYLNRQKRSIRRYKVGSLSERSLLELWMDPEYQAFRQRVQSFDFPACTLCGGCDMLETNAEDCFGNTFPTCGGCLWAQGVIQCP